MKNLLNRLESIVQPLEGYIPLNSFILTQLPILHKLHEGWTLPREVVTLTATYLFRVVRLNVLPKDVFNQKENEDLLAEVKDLSDSSIEAAVKLVYYSNFDNPQEEIIIEKKVVEDIREMVRRIGWFCGRFGKVERDPHIVDLSEVKGANIGFSGVRLDRFFISSGSAWLIDGIGLSKTNSLLLFVLYLFGRRSFLESSFSRLTNLGIFDPVSNIFHCIFVSDLDREVLKYLEEEVIGFK